MPEIRRVLVLVVICLASLASARNRPQQRTEDAAVRALGPRGQQISRDSGMIFSGTVVGIETKPTGDQGFPIIKVNLRVERAIAGVQPRQLITIREWAGAWSQRPMSVGQRVLLFLYPPSRLGLTSPVGGTLGQIAIEGDRLVIPPALVDVNHDGRQLRTLPTFTQGPRITVGQLERAIRSARGTQRPPLRRHLAWEE